MTQYCELGEKFNLESFLFRRRVGSCLLLPEFIPPSWPLKLKELNPDPRGFIAISLGQ